jgi:hypothetical protein
MLDANCKTFSGENHARTPHVVSSRGRRYCYAWRGGPRLSSFPGDPGFEAEYDEVWRATRTPAGKRKLVLKGSKKYSQTVEGLLIVAFENARQRARKRGIIFDLTENGLIEHMERINGKCELSGIAFNPSYDHSAKYAHNPYGVSIDRITPVDGYTPGNIRLVLTSVNFAINQWGFDAYLEVARAVTARVPMGV